MSKETSAITADPVLSLCQTAKAELLGQELPPQEQEHKKVAPSCNGDRRRMKSSPFRISFGPKWDPTCRWIEVLNEDACSLVWLLACAASPFSHSDR